MVRGLITLVEPLTDLEHVLKTTYNNRNPVTTDRKELSPIYKSFVDDTSSSTQVMTPSCSSGVESHVRFCIPVVLSSRLPLSMVGGFDMCGPSYRNDHFYPVTVRRLKRVTIFAHPFPLTH